MISSKPYIRDQVSKAILPRDMTAKKAYEKKVEQARRIKSLEDQVKVLEERINRLEQRTI